MKLIYSHPARRIAVCLLAVCGVPAMAQFQGPPVTAPVAPQLTGPTSKIPSTPDITARIPTMIHPGDQLEITLIGVNQASPWKNQVDSEGNVSLPYIGSIHVAGMEVAAMQSLIAQKLREGDYVLNAQVSVVVVGSPAQVIAVTGEVKSPALIPAMGERNLLDVIAATGGLTPQASHTITVVRKATNQSIQVVLDPNAADAAKENIPLYVGDVVIVPKAGSVYILGSVKTPNAIPLVSNTPLTVLQAISMAGGANYEASLSRVRIIRTEGAERKEIALDLKRVMEGKQADPILQADDIVYLPPNTMKGAIKGGGISVALSALLTSLVLLQ